MACRFHQRFLTVAPNVGFLYFIYFLKYLFSWLSRVFSCGICNLVPWLGVEPGPPTLGGWLKNARKSFPIFPIYLFMYKFMPLWVHRSLFQPKGYSSLLWSFSFRLTSQIKPARALSKRVLCFLTSSQVESKHFLTFWHKMFQALLVLSLPQIWIQSFVLGALAFFSGECCFRNKYLHTKYIDFCQSVFRPFWWTEPGNKYTYMSMRGQLMIPSDPQSPELCALCNHVGLSLWTVKLPARHAQGIHPGLTAGSPTDITPLGLTWLP